MANATETDKYARQRRYQAKVSEAARGIGDLPKPVDPDRREACRFDLERYLLTYHQAEFPLPFSDDHRALIKQLQVTILAGGMSAFAMPRGTGKTTIAIRAIIWATIYGHHKFAVLVAATQTLADAIVKIIFGELDGNPLLAEDFPEVCIPFIKLEGESRKCHGQTYKGQRTKIEMTGDKLVFATLEGFPEVSGTVLKAFGITGSIRGLQVRLDDGTILRPTLILGDDPQTDESAQSQLQSKKRYELLVKLSGLEGPDGRPLSMLIACTKIAEGDTTCMLMKDPSFRRTLRAICDTLPNDLKLWDEYWRIRLEEIEKDDSGKLEESTEFYRQRQAEMDAGCNPRWRERFKTNQISAVQYIMDIYLRNQQLFYAEYMNDPQHGQDGDDPITREMLTRKLNQLMKGMMPDSATKAVAFIDVHSSVLVWMVIGVNETFSGGVVDYGYWPKAEFLPVVLSQARDKISEDKRFASFEEQLRANIDECIDHLMAREFLRDDGVQVHLSRMLIDANWGPYTNLVYEAVREGNRRHQGRIYPSHGHVVKATSPLWALGKDKPGDQIGSHWRITKAEKRLLPHVVFDANWWKTFMANRLAAGKGENGSITLFGHKLYYHNTLAAHLMAEQRIKVTANNKTVDEWSMKQGQTENHFLDCLAGCCVAASIAGSVLPQAGHVPRKQFAPKREIPAHLRLR